MQQRTQHLMGGRRVMERKWMSRDKKWNRQRRTALLDTPTKSLLDKTPSPSVGRVRKAAAWGAGDTGDPLALRSSSERPPASRAHPAAAGADAVCSHCGQCLTKCFSSKADNPRDCSILWIIIKFLKLFNSWGGRVNHCTLLRARSCGHRD